MQELMCGKVAVGNREAAIGIKIGELVRNGFNLQCWRYGETDTNRERIFYDAFQKETVLRGKQAAAAPFQLAGTWQLPAVSSAVDWG